LVRNFQTSAVSRDIDSAAKFIGAGAATVGVAGSGECPSCCTAECCEEPVDNISFTCLQVLVLAPYSVHSLLVMPGTPH